MRNHRLVRTAPVLGLVVAGIALAFTLYANPARAGGTTANAKASCCPDGACCPDGTCCTAAQAPVKNASCCPGGDCCPEGACCTAANATAKASCCPGGACCPGGDCCGTAAQASVK